MVLEHLATALGFVTLILISLGLLIEAIRFITSADTKEAIERLEYRIKGYNERLTFLENKVLKKSKKR